jgi:hypothetical protein
MGKRTREEKAANAAASENGSAASTPKSSKKGKKEEPKVCCAVSGGSPQSMQPAAELRPLRGSMWAEPMQPLHCSWILSLPAGGGAA